MKKIVVLTLIIFSSMSVHASDPLIRNFDREQDFQNGEIDGVSLTSEGTILLSPEIVEICESEEPFIWDIVCDQNNNIYFSAGNSGKIYQLNSKGNCTLFCQLDEIEIFSLLIDTKNRLYAATSPDGKVYHIDSGGNATVFFDPKDTYIWDMVVDRQNRLYVATGDSGRIYKISSSAKSTLFYNSTENHIRCLAFDKNNQLLAGSFGNGYVYRINSSGDAFAIYDADLKEIHQLVVDSEGTIYAAALGRTAPYMPSKAPEKKKTKEQDEKENGDHNNGEAIVLDEISVEISNGKRGRKDFSESAIYKITAEGFIRNIWNSYNESVQSIALTSDGKIYVGTGTSGQLVKIDKLHRKTHLIELDEAQINAFCYNKKNELFFASSNLGKVYRLSNGFKKSGRYTSDIVDSYVISKWGNFSWEQVVPKGCSVKFYTRTGNTEQPNDTWSNWSSSLEDHNGFNISNPDARFLQWKVELATSSNNKTPIIKHISVSSLQQNIPPEIASITIYPPGEYYQNQQQNNDVKSSFLEDDDGLDNKSRSSRSNSRNHYLGRKMFRKGYRTASWLVVDDNDDDLMFHLLYRTAGEKHWKTLIKNWQSNSFAWDTNRLPDGKYYLKLSAHDSLSNPEYLFKKSTRISDEFIIDNSAPVVSAFKITGTNKKNINFTVTDKYTPISEVMYSIDGMDWKYVHPADGISDSRLERYNFDAGPISTGQGPHTLVVKAIDRIKNIGFGQTQFKD